MCCDNIVRFEMSDKEYSDMRYSIYTKLDLELGEYVDESFPYELSYEISDLIMGMLEDMELYR